MRLSDLIGKDIVNIFDGIRLGTVADSDLLIDDYTGRIDAILLPGKSRFLTFLSQPEMVIPWEAVRKIGDEVIIVEIEKDKRKPIFETGK